MTTAETDARETVRKRVLLVVVLTVFLDLVGFGITIPLLPLYVKSMTGGTGGFITGALIGSYSLMQALATPWLGKLSDRYGRRVVILLSLLGNAASMVLFALAVYWNVLPLLFVSRCLAGATAGNLSACQAAIADVTDRKDRSAAMGRLGAGIGLGMIVGPVIGATTGELATWAPPIAAAVMATLDLALAAILMPETRQLGGNGLPAQRPKARSLVDVCIDRRILAVLALYFLTFTSMTVLNVGFPLISAERFHWGQREVGGMFALFGISGVVIQGFLMKRLSRAFTELSLIKTAAACIGAGMLLAALSTKPWMLVVGNFIIGIGVAINNPSISTLASKYASSEEQGTVLGYAQSFGSWARTIWPPVWGFLYEHLAPPAPFIGAAIAASLLFGVGVILRTLKAPVSLQSEEQPS